MIATPARTDWPVVIIGAGPAGAATAIALGRLGISCLLLERTTFPRGKVCGCCLNRDALAACDRLGVGSRVRAIGGAPLRRLALTARGRTASIRLAGGCAVERRRLDALLVDAAVDAGATFIAGRAARVEASSSASMTVATNVEAYHARVVIVADGLNGRSLAAWPQWRPHVAPRSHIGLGTILAPGALPVPEGAIEMACHRHGYVGAVRLADARIDVAAAVDPVWLKAAGGPRAAVDRMRAEAGAAPIEGEDAGWMGTGRLTRRRPDVAGPRFFVVGDAAGYVEPFTGEGMAWAMTAAERVAPFARIAAERGWSDELADAWRREHAEQVRRRQRGCRLVAHGLRRDGLVAGGVRLLRVAPWLAAPVTALIGRPRPSVPLPEEGAA